MHIQRAEMRQSELNLGLFILMRHKLSGNHNTSTHYRHLAFYIQMLRMSIQVDAIIIYIRISLLYNGILVTPLTQLTQN